MSENPLAPAYARDLRNLMERSFSGGPIPASVVPSGSLHQRVAAQQGPEERHLSAAPLDCTRVGSAQVAAVRHYYQRCLGHRPVIAGPLLELAEDNVNQELRRIAEQELWRAYDSFDAIPLPPDVLALIRAQPRNPWYLDWVEDMWLWTRTRSADVGEQREVQRVEILEQVRASRWSEERCALSELLCDLMLLMAAVARDVERAREDHPEAPSLVLASRHDTLGLEYQDVLVQLAEHASIEPWSDATADEYARFAGGREKVWDAGILSESTEAAVPAGNTGVVMASRSPADRYRDLVDRLESRIIGRADLCRELALIGMGHEHGIGQQRVLLAGPTGSGKSHSARSLAEALDSPYAEVSCADLTSTGWSGRDITSTVEDLAREAASGKLKPVLLLDEIDKIRLPRDSESAPRQRAAQMGLQSSLLGLLDGAPVTPALAEGIETADWLVLAAGAFAGRFSRPPSTSALIEWGFMPELAGRFDHRLCLSPVGQAEVLKLLRNSERSVQQRLGPLLDVLELEVEVPEPVLQYTAGRLLSTGADFRTASSWLLQAARRRVIDALDSGERRIVLTPDDLEIDRGSGGNETG